MHSEFKDKHANVRLSQREKVKNKIKTPEIRLQKSQPTDIHIYKKIGNKIKI